MKNHISLEKARAYIGVGTPPRQWMNYLKVYRLKKVDATRISTKTEYSFKGL